MEGSTNHLEEKLKDEAITAANTLNSAIGLYMLEGDYAKISPLTYSLQSEPNIAYVIVKDKEGTTINQKGARTNPDHLIPVKVPLEYFQVQLGEVEIGLKTTSLNQQKGNFFQITNDNRFDLFSTIVNHFRVH